MKKKRYFTDAEAKTIGEKLGIRWDEFDVAEYRKALNEELEAEEHEGLLKDKKDLTAAEKAAIGRVTFAHINEFTD